jgi:asparagine synthase (glutamine-hydrolysing)
MAAAMHYDMAYTYRLYESSEVGIAVGWVGRCDEVATRGPIHDAERRVFLFLSGEPYCERTGTASHLANMPAEQSEAGRIIDHYGEVGPTFLKNVSGLFSGLLVDDIRNEAFLFNDRLGFERLFTYEDRDLYLFSSEAKAILAAVPEARKFDATGLAQFLVCGCTFGDASLFRGIRVLPAGTVVTFANGILKGTDRYFDRSSWESVAPVSAQEFLEELGDRLESVVAKQTTPPPSVAVSLTGGLDSRMIMSCLQSDGTIPCYTFGSMYRETFDVRVAAMVAKRCGQPHQVLVLGQEFVTAVREYLEKAVFISDGYLGLSGAAELYLNRLARAVAATRITGNYGGELLRGFRAFQSVVPRGDFLLPEMGRRIADAVQTFRAIREIKPLTFTLFHQSPSGYGRYAIERSQVTVRSPFLDDQISRCLHRKPDCVVGACDTSKFVIGRRRPDLLSIATDRGLLGRGGKLRCGTRQLYRESLFKAEYWTGHGAPHWMAAFAQFPVGRALHRLFIGRHKFLHARPLIEIGLADYLRSVLVEDHLTPLDAYVDPCRVDAMVQQHLSGKRNYWEELDKLLTMALTCRHLFQTPSPLQPNPSRSVYRLA